MADTVLFLYHLTSQNGDSLSGNKMAYYCLTVTRLRVRNYNSVLQMTFYVLASDT